MHSMPSLSKLERILHITNDLYGAKAFSKLYQLLLAEPSQTIHLAFPLPA